MVPSLFISMSVANCTTPRTARYGVLNRTDFEQLSWHVLFFVESAKYFGENFEGFGEFSECFLFINFLEIF